MESDGTPSTKPHSPNDIWQERRDSIIERIRSGNYTDPHAKWFFRWVLSGKPKNPKSMIKPIDYDDALKKAGGENFLVSNGYAITENVTMKKEGYTWIETEIKPNPNFPS